MISESAYQKAAQTLGVSEAAIKAFATVESAGNGFQSDGQVRILFERHVFYKQLVSAHGQSFADAQYKANPDICNPVAGGYGSFSIQHDKLNRAVAIDRDCALCSASWGAFQIMGYQWKICQYASLQEFINGMQTDDGQIDSLVRFLKANPSIVRAINAKNWAAAAKGYNGPNYAQNQYDTKLSAAYAKFGGQ